MQDDRDIERREARLILELIEAHRKTELLCDVMGVAGTATLVRIQRAIMSLAPVQEDNLNDDDTLPGGSGLLIAVALCAPIWAIGLSLVLA